MILLLIFLLSWLSGLFSIFLLAFFVYETFSIIDITFFSIIMLAACFVMIPFYLLILKLVRNKISKRRQCVLFPLVLVAFSNLPAYFLIWQNTNDLYRVAEAFLLLIGIVVTAIVFGISWAWKSSSGIIRSNQ